MAAEESTSRTTRPLPEAFVEPLPTGDEATHVSSRGVASAEPSPSSGRMVLGEAAAAANAQPEDKTIISKRTPLADAAPIAITTPQYLGQTLAGKRLEHYELDEFVGGGGMGAVFRATDTRLGRTVAVKVLSRDHTDQETIRRFQNEAQSAARLDHPNIARAYYVGEDQGWNFIVFEYIEGTNLRDLVDERGPLELEDALHFTLQVGEALSHSSSRDVVHRDIKPSNVLVMAGGRVKLVDMGLARLHQVESASDDLTASGVTLGTFDYISPEQARDPRSADVRSDIYSLGCTLYYMLTGRPPFPDGTALQKLLRHNADEPPDVRIFRPEFSPRITALLAKMLAKRPSQRHQSAAELIADILAVGQQLGLSGISKYGQVVIAPHDNGQQLWAKTWQILMAVAILIAGIVLLDAYLPSRGTGNEVSLEPTNLKPPEDPLAAPPALPGNPSRVPLANAPSPGASGVQSVAATRPDSAIADDVNREVVAPAIEGARDTAGEGDPGIVDLSGSGVTMPGDESAIGMEPFEVAIGIGPLEQSPVPIAVAEQATRVALIGSRPAPPDPGVAYARTLAEACRQAAELGISEIELHFSGRHVERPVDLALPRLTLRAGMGFKPIIVFQPMTGVTTKEMIRMTGGSSARLSVQGVELRMELPTEGLASGWTLVSMGSGQMLEFTNAVLTVQNGDGSNGPLHDQVAMITVQPRKSAETMTMMDPQPSMAQTATITLEHSIARGAATFLRMPDETPLAVRWNQGLLVTPQRLIETGGSMTDPKWYESIALTLDNVTAKCRGGLYLMKRRPGADYQFAVNATLRNCIVMPDDRQPLYEFIGTTSITQDDLQSSGEENCYPSDVLFLRTQSGLTGDEAELFELNRHASSDELSPKAGAPWIKPPPESRPPHELGPNDFLATEDADAGFDPALMPVVATSAVPPAMPPQPATSDFDEFEPE